MAKRLNPVLYVSTNPIWGGSEELWTRSVKSFVAQGYAVAFAATYEHPQLREIEAPFIHFAESNGMVSILKRGVQRLTPLRFPKHVVLKKFIQQAKPRLIIISQGDTYQALDVIRYCGSMGIPYIIVTQLVGEIFIWAYADDKLPIMRKAYTAALKNYYVSQHNLELHNAMLGLDLPNAELVYNPCKIMDADVPHYPKPNGIYNIGLVGRIDCWHKGYDFLLQIARMEKWQQRAVQFNLYGSGPYLLYMKSIVASRGLSNIVFKGHSNKVSDVWRENQMLLLPSRIEGQALALIEAMKCQRAAVVTNVGGAAELIEEGHSGFVAAAPTVDAIDAALERAWQQRSQWKTLGLNAAAALRQKYPADAVAYFNEKIERELAALA